MIKCAETICKENILFLQTLFAIGNSSHFFLYFMLKIHFKKTDLL